MQTMQLWPRLPAPTFASWATLEIQLRDHLHRKLDAESTEHIVARARKSFEMLRLPRLAALLDQDEMIRFELATMDFLQAQSRTLAVLTRSFIAVELAKKARRSATASAPFA